MVSLVQASGTHGQPRLRDQSDGRRGRGAAQKARMMRNFGGRTGRKIHTIACCDDGPSDFPAFRIKRARLAGQKSCRFPKNFCGSPEAQKMPLGQGLLRGPTRKVNKKEIVRRSKNSASRAIHKGSSLNSSPGSSSRHQTLNKRSRSQPPPLTHTTRSNQQHHARKLVQHISIPLTRRS